MKRNVFENEEWKQIPEYPNYSISDSGHLKNLKTGNIIFGSTVNKNGTIGINLFNANGKKKFTIAKLVADAFIPNDNNYKFVIHIDGNRANNKSENLKWSPKTHI